MKFHLRNIPQSFLFRALVKHQTTRLQLNVSIADVRLLRQDVQCFQIGAQVSMVFVLGFIDAAMQVKKSVWRRVSASSSITVIYAMEIMKWEEDAGIYQGFH